MSKGDKKEKKGKGKSDNNKYAVVSFNYSSMPMTNHDRMSFINVPTGKLPHFDGTNFAKWKNLMRAYLIGLHPGIWEVVCRCGNTAVLARQCYSPVVPPSGAAVPAGKLPHFNGTNFAKWKHLMRAYLIGLHPGIWEIVCNRFEPPVDPKNPTLEEMRIIHLNGQATSVFLVLWMVMSTIE